MANRGGGVVYLLYSLPVDNNGEDLKTSSNSVIERAITDFKFTYSREFAAFGYSYDHDETRACFNLNPHSRGYRNYVNIFGSGNLSRDEQELKDMDVDHSYTHVLLVVRPQSSGSVRYFEMKHPSEIIDAKKDAIKYLESLVARTKAA